MDRSAFGDPLSRCTQRDARRLAKALIAIQRPLGETDARFRPPRPARSALATTCPLLVFIMLSGVGALSWRVSAFAAAALLPVVIGRAAFVLHDRARSRRLADRLLRSHPGSPLGPLAAWRAAELTSVRSRNRLRRASRMLRRESVCCLSPGPPLAGISEAAVRESILLLRELEARLGDVAEPVSVAGVLAVSELVIGDCWSPLYFPERPAELRDALAGALDRLSAR